MLTLTVVSAQHKVGEKVNQFLRDKQVFKPFTLLTATSETPNAEVSRVVDGATFATINLAQVNDIVANRYPFIEVTVPYEGRDVVVQLFEDNILAPGFHVDSDKGTFLSYTPGVYYKGIVKGDSQSVAALSFFENEFNGIISNGELTNLVVGKLHTPNNVNDYIVYSDSKMKVLNQFNCSVKDEAGAGHDHDHEGESAARSEQTTKCVTMYFEIDHDIYLQNSSSVTGTVNWMTSAFNNVETLYSNDAIDVALRSTYVWTTPDPYEGEGSSDYLYQFNAQRPIFDGDLGQLVGIDPGGLGGVAVTINGMCTQNNFSYSDVNFSYNTVPTYSWTVMVITHEMGHLMGSRHTHNCSWNGNNTGIDNCAPSVLGVNTEGYSCMTNPPTIPSTSTKGTIMSYCHLVGGVGISFLNGFGPQPRAAIVNAVNSRSCLSTDCVNTCINTVSSINITNLTNSSVSFTWTDLSTSVSSWMVDVLPFNSNFPSWETVSTNSYTQNGLNPNTYYKIRIRPACGTGITASNREWIFATPANWCNGITIYDTGGANNDYTDGQDYVRVMIPDVPNKKIALTFTAFNLETDYDYMWIYDGNSTSAPEMTPGGLTGTSIPGPFVSTAADGSLTLRFFSDPGVVEDGYAATVNCQDNLSVPGFEGIDFTYYPNPSNGIVNIVGKKEITDLMVYNPQGRLLYRAQPNVVDPKVDISAFATGTYFFKVRFGDAEANFKIMKN